MMQPTWQTPDGSIRLYHADCRDVLRELPSGCIDLVITDPPYNVGIDYGEHNDNMSQPELSRWLREWFIECRRVAKTVLVTTGQKRLPDYAAIEPWKWLLQWWKPAAMGRSPVGFCEWEPIGLWGEGSHAGMPDVIRAPIIPQKDTGDHPCPKPIHWAVGQLERFPEAQSVLDPFMGSGTTGVACARLGRRFTGIEQEQRFVATAIDRISEALSLPLFDQPTYRQRSLLDGAA